MQFILVVLFHWSTKHRSLHEGAYLFTSLFDGNNLALTNSNGASRFDNAPMCNHTVTNRWCEEVDFKLDGQNFSVGRHEC